MLPFGVLRIVLPLWRNEEDLVPILLSVRQDKESKDFIYECRNPGLCRRIKNYWPYYLTIQSEFYRA